MPPAFGQESQQLVAPELIGRLVKAALGVAEDAHVVDSCRMRAPGHTEVVAEAVERVLQVRPVGTESLKLAGWECFFCHDE